MYSYMIIAHDIDLGTDAFEYRSMFYNYGY